VSAVIGIFKKRIHKYIVKGNQAGREEKEYREIYRMVFFDSLTALSCNICTKILQLRCIPPVLVLFMVDMSGGV